MLLFIAGCFTRNISPISQNSVIIYSPFHVVSNLYDLSSTQRENCNEAGGFKFQKECKNTIKVVLITCVLDSWSSETIP